MILKFNLFTDSLCEKIIHPKFKPKDDVKQYDIFSYNKYVFFVDNVWVDFPLKLKSLLKIPKKLEDGGSIMSHINEERPDIIHLEWKTDSKDLDIVLSSSDFTQDVRVSKYFIDTLKLLKKEIGIRYLNIVETFYDKEGSEHEDTEYYNIDELIRNFEQDLRYKKMPDKIYHGTSSRHLPGILRLGIHFKKELSNFKDTGVYHKNKIFLTSSKYEATFYSHKACKVSGGFPIILEIDGKSIDTNKVLLDYDFYIQYVKKGMSDYNISYKTARKGYDQLAQKPVLGHLKSKYIGATFRKFGYNGRVFPKNINSIWYSTSYDDEKFDEEYDNPVKSNASTDDLLGFFDFAEEYGYTADEYYLDYDAYHEYKEEMEREDEDEDTEETEEENHLKSVRANLPF